MTNTQIRRQKNLELVREKSMNFNGTRLMGRRSSVGRAEDS